MTIQDPVGDAGSGPDISALTATVSDGSLTLSVTFANRSSLGTDESVDFFIGTYDGGTLDAAFFPGGQSLLYVWNGSSYQPVHDIQETFANNTLTTTLSLSDLQDAVHQPVVPQLIIAVETFTNSAVNPTLADQAPDGGFGFVAVSTQPAATTVTTVVTTTVTTTTPTAPVRRPQLIQKTAHVAGSRIEWKKLEIDAVPTGGQVSIVCTKACSLSEKPRVNHGVAVSKRFVGVPLARGATFVIRVLRGSGTGYWFRITVKGASATTARGCIANGGQLAGPAGC